MANAFALPLQQLWTHRDLLYELVSRELKVRYRRSALGFLWSLITPIYQIVIYTVVLKYIMGWGPKNLSVSILVAIIPWTFFSVGVLNSCSAVMRYRNVVKKVYFPRQMLPLATVMANLIHLALSVVVLFALFLVIPVAFTSSFFFLIVLVAGQTLLVAGLGFIVGCLHTFYQDVEYALTNLMQVGMFLTPVIYPFSMLNNQPDLYRTLYYLNPMAVYTEGWRGLLLRNEYPDPYYLAVALGVSFITFLTGLVLWRRYEWRFPEVI
ncbi:MAG: ABC transporter permease [Armatimonadia bacterium]